MKQFIFCYPVVAAAADGKKNIVCPNVFIDDGIIQLNKNEKILVCGKPNGPEGWKNVPLSQSEFYLKSILNELGYHQPTFKNNFTELRVTKGERTLIKEMRSEGAQHLLPLSKKRKIIDQPMIPAKLNEFEHWVNLKIKSNGYPCSQQNLTADVEDKIIFSKVDLSSPQVFGEISVSGLGALEPTILERYQPFEKDQLYDIRKTQIMTSRMLDKGLFQSAFFTDNCPEINRQQNKEQSEAKNNNFKMDLKVSIGKPNIIRFGVGASTEEFPFIDTTYKNTHLDSRASSYTINAHASPRIKSLWAEFELYLIKNWIKSFFSPKIKFSQESESSYEINTARLALDMGRGWDTKDLRFNVSGGPAVNITQTLRGQGPEDIKYTSFEGFLQIISHNYEYNLREQYEGWTFIFKYREQNRGLGSAVDLHSYQTQLKMLWNLGNYSPPLFVLGTRIESRIVDVYARDENIQLSLIPFEDRIFMGGDQNLRGFPRGSINNENQGYLTSLYLGWELRLIEELPYRLQPFLLWDLAKLGTREYRYNSSTLSSQGAGLRWASPFGTLRFSAAKGQILNKTKESTNKYPESWNYFLSFGQEF